MPNNNKPVILPILQLPTLPIIPRKRTRIGIVAANKPPSISLPSRPLLSALPVANSLADKPIQFTFQKPFPAPAAIGLQGSNTFPVTPAMNTVATTHHQQQVLQPIQAPVSYPRRRQEHSTFLYENYAKHPYVDATSPPLPSRPGSASNTWIPASTIHTFPPGNQVPSVPRVSLTSIQRGRRGNRWKARSTLPRRIASDQVPATFPIPEYRQHGPRSGLNKVIPIPRPITQDADALAVSQRDNYGKSGTGAISPNHTFTSDATVHTILAMLLRYGGFSIAQLYPLRLITTGWRWLIDAWLLASTYTPTLVQHWRPNQQSIPAGRIANMTMLAINCDLNPGVLARALGDSYSSEHRVRLYHDIELLLGAIVTPEHKRQYERSLTVGAPERLVHHSSTAHREAFLPGR